MIGPLRFRLLAAFSSSRCLGAWDGRRRAAGVRVAPPGMASVPAMGPILPAGPPRARAVERHLHGARAGLRGRQQQLVSAWPAHWYLPRRPGVAWRVASALTCVSVLALSKLTMALTQTRRVHHRERMEIITRHRPGIDRPIVTVCNHPSRLDENMLWSCFPFLAQMSHNRFRWAIGADNICFKNKYAGLFFSLGQTIPVSRGSGVFQPGMDFAIELINAGIPVHIYPEGRVNDSGTLLPMRWGVGRLVAEAAVTPLVVPLFVKGTADIMPLGFRLPNWGREMDLMVGEPLDLAPRLQELRHRGPASGNPAALRRAVTDRVETALVGLRQELAAILPRQPRA